MIRCDKICHEISSKKNTDVLFKMYKEVSTSYRMLLVLLLSHLGSLGTKIETAENGASGTGRPGEEGPVG